MLLSECSLPGNVRLFGLRDCPGFRQLSDQLNLLSNWKLGNSAIGERKMKWGPVMSRIDPRKLTLALVIVSAGCAGAGAQTQTKARRVGREEQAIRNNVKQMETGWNTKSGLSFAKPFAANADYVVIDGTHLVGHELIEKAHQRISTPSLRIQPCLFRRSRFGFSVRMWPWSMCRVN